MSIADHNARQSAFYAENDRTVDAGPDPEPLDAWLRVSDDEDHSDFDPLPDGRYPAEANTYPDGDEFRVDWYLTAVGLVVSEYFPTLEDAHTWLEREGFQDFTS